MKTIVLAVSLVFTLCASSAIAQIPEQFQQIILKNVPQADANGDGKVTAEEIKQVYPSLPAAYQEVLRKRLPEVVGEGTTNKQRQAKPSFKYERPAGDPAIGRKKGYNCLFMGHSFFFPIVSNIGGHAKQLGLDHHQQYVVRAGGASGSPGSLWSSKKPDVLHAKKLIESGDVELLALTGHYLGSTLEDYRRWVDLALKHNPRTVFVIQVPWVIKNNKRLPQYSAEVKVAAAAARERIDRLREAYPKTTFLCVPQGLWMVELWRLYEAEELPELTRFVANGKANSKKALFRDNFGHGGELAEKQGALLWLPVLYGTDLNAYNVSTGTRFDLKGLAQKIFDDESYCRAQEE